MVQEVVGRQRDHNQGSSDPGENIIANIRMKGKGDAERFWKETEALEDKNDEEMQPTVTSHPEVEDPIEQSGTSSSTQDPTRTTSGAGVPYSTPMQNTQGSSDPGGNGEGQRSPAVDAVEEEDLARCEACKEDFDCETICQECMAMKCKGCTAHQVCGTCNKPICRQCTKIHGKKCCADRSANAHLHFPSRRIQARGLQPRASKTV